MGSTTPRVKTQFKGIYRRGKSYSVWGRDSEGKAFFETAHTLKEAKQLRAEFKGRER